MLRIVGSFYFIGVVSLVSASGSCPQQNFIDNHEKRQVQTTTPLIIPLPSTSTSSFNWWPYPPAITSTPLQTVTEVNSEDDDPSEATETSTSNISLLLEGSTESSLTQTPGSGSSGSDTTTTSALITITALPPLTSPSEHSHRVSAYRQPMNPALFAPLVGILGLATGLIFGWYMCGYWKRRQDTGRENRLAGPKYEGVKVDDLDDDRKNPEKHDYGEIVDTVIKEILVKQPSLCKDNIPGVLDSLSGPTRRQSGSLWSRINLSMLHRFPLFSGILGGYKGVTRDSNVQGDNNVQGVEADHFKAALLSPSSPAVFGSVALSDEDDKDCEDARCLLDRRRMVRHKSISKRLVERLHQQLSPEGALARTRSGRHSKARGTTPELEEGVLLQDNFMIADSPEKTPLRRTKTRPANSALGHGRAISDFSVPLDSIQQPPRVYTLKNPGVTIAPLKSGSGFESDDKYTPLPECNVRSGRKLVSVRSTRRRTEIIEDSEGPPKFNFPGDSDRRVLPTSPPLLSTPELESALFFSPNGGQAGLPQGASRSARFHHAEYHALPGLDMGSPTRGSPSRRAPLGPRQSRKLVSKHSPGSGIDPFADDARPSKSAFLTPTPLRRSTARASSCSPTKRGYGSGSARQGRERSSTLPSIPLSPRERFEARQTAFDKVDAIVERSWSARLLQGTQVTPDPTVHREITS